MSLKNYYTVLRHASFINGLRNSVLLSVTIALVTVLAGIVMAFTIHRTRAFGTKIFEFIGTLPLGLSAAGSIGRLGDYFYRHAAL